MAVAQRAIPVIGALSPADRSALDTSIYAGFSLGMRELGYEEGKDYLLEWRFAGGDYERLPELAKELIGRKVSVIFATSTAAVQAAHKVTTTIPIVMGFYEDDPTESGLAATLGHPAGNVTGLAAMEMESISKPLDLLRTIFPNLQRLAVLFNPILGSYRTALRNVKLSSEKIGVTVLDWEASSPQGIDDAFDGTGQERNLDAVFLIGDAFFFAHRRHIVELSVRNRLAPGPPPVIAAQSRTVAPRARSD